jgi:hypothetical protein
MYIGFSCTVNFVIMFSDWCWSTLQWCWPLSSPVKWLWQLAVCLQRTVLNRYTFIGNLNTLCKERGRSHVCFKSSCLIVERVSRRWKADRMEVWSGFFSHSLSITAFFSWFVKFIWSLGSLFRTLKGDRGRMCMLTVLAQMTLWKNKKWK